MPVWCVSAVCVSEIVLYQRSTGWAYSVECWGLDDASALNLVDFIDRTS